jgi:hypothetical protein
MNFTAIIITLIICTSIVFISIFGGKDKGDKDE